MTVTINGTTGITSPAETVGSTITYADTGILATYASSSTSYNQVILQNSNSGTASSTDVIVSNDQGTASTYYGDFGMNSSGWTGSLPFSAANVVYLTSTSGPLSLGSVTSNPVYIATNSTTAVTIDTSQNVGIGTSSPVSASRLTVTGSLSVNGSDGNFSAGGNRALLDLNTPGGTNYVRFGGCAGGASTPVGIAFQIGPASGGCSEAARIDSSGNLIVGSGINSTAVGQVTVFGAASTKTEFYISRSGQVEGHIGFLSGSGNTNWYFNTGSSLGTNGLYQTNNGTSWNSNSDERLKTDLVPISNAVEKVSSIRSVTGRYKTDPVGTSRAFVIAQDVQAVLPEAVSTTHIEGDDTTYFGVAYTDLIPLLIAATKELNATITDLQAKLKSAGVAGF